MSDKTELPGKEDIGNGLNCFHDGHQLWLELNGHPEKVLAINPKAFANLLDYARRFNRAAGRAHFKGPEEKGATR